MTQPHTPPALPDDVAIVEVGPRDGLQSLERVYPVAVRGAMIRELVQAGVSVMEATSFMRPDVVPQMRDAEDLMALLRQEAIACTFRALVPNARGAERAAAAGVDEFAALFTCSETYAMKNQNMTIEENFRAVEDVAAIAEREKVPLLVSMGLTMFCPYEGPVPPDRVHAMIERLRAWGVRRVTIATTAGVDGPGQLYALASGILERWPDMHLGYHLHNTNGLGSANILAALQAGVGAIETSIGGLGGGIRMPRGMPYFGNFPTEDLVQMLSELGVRTGIELDAILAASERIQALLELDEVASFAARGGTRQRILELSAG
jgi:hydroxymethylglutaryl-CoA lyase